MKVRRVLTEDSWKFLSISFGRCEIQQEAGIIKKIYDICTSPGGDLGNYHLQGQWHEAYEAI